MAAAAGSEVRTGTSIVEAVEDVQRSVKAGEVDIKELVELSGVNGCTVRHMLKQSPSNPRIRTAAPVVLAFELLAGRKAGGGVGAAPSAPVGEAG